MSHLLNLKGNKFFSYLLEIQPSTDIESEIKCCSELLAEKENDVMKLKQKLENLKEIQDKDKYCPFDG